MDYKLAYLVIGILIILIFFKNNKSYLEKKMNINSSEGFKNNNNNNNNSNNNNNNNNNSNNNNNNNTNNDNEIAKRKDKQITKLQEKIVSLNRMNKNLKNTVKDYASRSVEYGDDKILQYNKTLEDYIDEVNKNKASIDLLNIGKDIEDGIFELSDNFDKTKDKVLDIFEGKFNEGFKNDKSEKNNTKNQTKNKKTKQKTNSKSNFKNYVIIDKLKKELLNNSNEDSNNDDNKKSELDEDMLAYFKHIFDKMYEIFKKYFNLYINKNNTFNLGNISKENNTLIGGGILFLVISMGLYFIDISS